jgi:kumamolisin
VRHPTAENDLNVFSSQFRLPACTTANGCFKKVFASSSKPNSNCGWGQEAALDMEWAHAMAPLAKIVLVEAASSSFTNLFTAVDVATAQVTTGGGEGEVSMSWSGGEFSTESSNDSHFQNTNVVYFASSGDTGGVNGYPSVSPYVVSAGGTTIHRNSTGAFTGETCRSGSGGGPSKYETKLSYQNIAGTNSTKRSAPDFSFDADPNSGVSVYDSTRCQGSSGWLVFGGTSVSSPSLAGIVNLAGHFVPSAVSELTTITATTPIPMIFVTLHRALPAASALFKVTILLPALAATWVQRESELIWLQGLRKIGEEIGKRDATSSSKAGTSTVNSSVPFYSRP